MGRRSKGKQMEKVKLKENFLIEKKVGWWKNGGKIR
jgi:hypothetical protein